MPESTATRWSLIDVVDGTSDVVMGREEADVEVVGDGVV